MPAVFATISRLLNIGTPLLTKVERVLANFATLTFFMISPSMGSFSMKLSSINFPCSVFTYRARAIARIMTPIIPSRSQCLIKLLSAIKICVGKGRDPPSISKIPWNVGTTLTSRNVVIPIAIETTAAGYTIAVFTFLCRDAVFSR